MTQGRMKVAPCTRTLRKVTGSNKTMALHMTLNHGEDYKKRRGKRNAGWKWKCVGTRQKLGISSSKITTGCAHGWKRVHASGGDRWVASVEWDHPSRKEWEGVSEIMLRQQVTLSRVSYSLLVKLWIRVLSESEGYILENKKMERGRDEGGGGSNNCLENWKGGIRGKHLHWERLRTESVLTQTLVATCNRRELTKIKK